MIRTVKSIKVYENPFVDVYDDAVEFGDGSEGRYFYSRWKAPHGVVALIERAGEVLLIRSYRYSEGCYAWELPQGFGTHGSEPAADCRREVLEETGLVIARIEPLYQFGSRFVTHAFHCHVPTTSDADATGREASESIAGFRWISREEASLPGLANLGVIDPVSAALLLAWANT